MKRNDIHRWSASAVCFLLATVFASYEAYENFCVAEESQVEPITVAEAIPMAVAPVEEEELVKTVSLKVGAGDTLASILARQKISHREIHLLTNSIRDLYKAKDLKPGLEIQVTLAKAHKDDRNPTIQEMKVRPSIDYEVIAIRNDEGVFECEKREIRLIEERRWAEAKIDGSLSEAANRYGVPQQILQGMISGFSHSVDFQRGIKEGDTFGLMYTVFTDPETGRQRPGNLLYAKLTTDGKPNHIYRYKPKNGVLGFYNEKGESLRKGLMRTPVDGARISSRFGMRMHPVQGYHKHHKGVDFAVPHGTPVMAAGDGVVERADRYGAYGNYVCVRHSNGYKTAYAHLSKFGKGVRRGAHLKQGQVLGHVGATGRTTGAHLHYEILVGGKQINPLSVKTMPTAKLTGKQKDEFNHTKRDFDLKYAQLKQSTALAEARTDFKRG
jgi:murein DD-endopeptidase MepM/ murein hydrolase activator NlpD